MAKAKTAGGGEEIAAPAVTVGRMVHYGVRKIEGENGGDLLEPHAAVITAVHAHTTGDVVSLTIFHPDGRHDVQRAPYAEELTEYCWSWPPRVD